MSRPVGCLVIAGPSGVGKSTLINRIMGEERVLAFDMPGPFGPKGRRSVSNVPAQSLALMNDPFVIEQAKLWAKKSLSQNANLSPETRIAEMYEGAFATLPDENELAAIQQFLNQQAAEYGGALDERAWADVAHVMFNLKEFLYLN